MKIWTIPLAVVTTALLGLASQVAWAGEGGGMHSRLARLLHGTELSADGVAAHLDAVAAKLELSAEQRKQVAGLLTEALPVLEARALELATAHVEQLERVHAEEFDEAAIRAASVRAGATQAEFAVAAARLLRDCHAVLTPEQLARLGEFHVLQRCEGVGEHVRTVQRGMKEWVQRQ